MRPFFLLFSLAILSSSCVKDEGVVSEANNANGTTSGGTSSGGTSTGGTSTGSSSQTDPLLAESWHYHSEGTTGKGYSTSLAQSDADINVKLVHDVLGIKGKNVRIAVSDTGVEINHPDLAANTLPGEHRNYIYNDSSEWADSDPTPGAEASEPHGTSVAGLISAVGWNGIGSRGIAPLSKFAAFKYIFTPLTYDANTLLAKEIDQLNGDFDIFNQSYGRAGHFFVETNSSIENALRVNTVGSSTVPALRNGKGAIYVQAAGNSFEEIYSYPANLPNNTRTAAGNTNAHEELSTPFKIVVGALSGNSNGTYGMKASYSTPGSSIWVSAPGGEDGNINPAIITTDMEGCRIGYSLRSFLYPDFFNFGFHPANPKCDYTNTFNGTSAAAPIVSGVVALMLEANSDLTWRDVKHILATTADKIDLPGDLEGDANKIINANNPFSTSGFVYDKKWVKNFKDVYFSNWYGFGKVNAYEAVQAAYNYNSSLGTFEETKDPNGLWYYDSGIVNQPIPNLDPAGVESKIWVGHNFEIEHVQIELTTNHTFIGDLAISLTSPSGPFGTKSTLLNINNKIFGTNLINFKMSSNAFYSEESHGFWTLKIVDGSGNLKDLGPSITTPGSGELTRWKILVSGHRKSTELELSKPYPPTGIVINDPAGASPPTSVSFNPPEVTGTYTYKVQLDDGGWLDATSPYILPTLVPGTTYQFKVKAINPATGSESYIQLKEWTEQ
jgi:subtilisin family serine protease/subtilisin-like proprotein convertase family protein